LSRTLETEQELVAALKDKIFREKAQMLQDQPEEIRITLQELCMNLTDYWEVRVSVVLSVEGIKRTSALSMVKMQIGSQQSV
jgi:hypothetical protein